MLVRNGIVGDWRLDDAHFLGSFRLPSTNEKTETLKARNPFPREDAIVFKEDTHEYFVRGEKVPISVTGLIHKYAGEFDAMAAVACMKRSFRWEERQFEFTKDTGEIMTDMEIVNKWNNNGNVQSARGTLFHYHVEQYLNGCSIETPHSPEFQQFLSMYTKVIQPKYTAYRTELCVYSPTLKLAGQIDGLFKDRDGHFVIWDWKRVRELKMEGREPLRDPLQNMGDCNWSLYCLQLNVYKWILEKEYGAKVSAMFLACCHPCRPYPLVIEVPTLDDYIALLVEGETM